MNKVSIDLVAPGRVETTIQTEPDWVTQQPYVFVAGSLQEAIGGLPELYEAVRNAQRISRAAGG